ncbi:MAG: hypothetical protein WC415_03730 [Patescibacteria group bacterium]|jgi:hypothetical protein
MQISLLVEKLEEGRAFLRDEKGRLIVWPRDFLPTESEIGQNLTMSVGQNSSDNSELAKQILNKLLNNK